LLQYVLAILLLITVISIVVAYDFNFSFAFHTPGSGATVINGQMYANNGTDKTLAPLFVKPMNGSTFANLMTPQSMNGSVTNAVPTIPQSINGTQNLTSSPSDIISHLNLARQALELGDPNTILKELDFIEKQLYFIAKNTTSDFSTMSNFSSSELEATKVELEDIQKDIPTDEQSTVSPSAREDIPQRTRGSR
jgi:hypothetical protein